jgi:hypothetical protein
MSRAMSNDLLHSVPFKMKDPDCSHFRRVKTAALSHEKVRKCASAYGFTELPYSPVSMPHRLRQGIGHVLAHDLITGLKAVPRNAAARLESRLTSCMKSRSAANRREAGGRLTIVAVAVAVRNPSRRRIEQPRLCKRRHDTCLRWKRNCLKPFV